MSDVIRGDQRFAGSELKRREADRTAADLVGVLSALALWQVTHPTFGLDVCAACGSLERADRACQVCRARRAAA